MPSRLRAIEHADYSGGIDAASSPYKVAKNKVLRALNFVLTEDGALTVRDGSLTIDRAPDTTTRLLSLYNLLTVDDAPTLYALGILRTPGAQQLAVRTSPAWTPLGAFQTRYDTPTILAWLNEAFVAAGYEVPWRTNGVTMTQLTASALPSPGAPMVTVSTTGLGVPSAPVVTPTGTPGVTTYTYELVALNALGSTSHSPPGTTTTGTATLDGNNYNLLTWAPVQDALRYQLYRTVGGASQGLIATVEASTLALVDDGTLAGNGATPPTADTTAGTTTYTYVLTAINNTGETPASAPGTTTTGSRSLSPSQFNTLTWTAVPGATGYRVYRTVGGGTQSLIRETASTTLVDTGLTGTGQLPPTANTTASVTPGARWLALHENALWAWNTAAATSAYDGPSSLRMSDVNEPASWPPAFQLFVDKDDGQEGTGLGVFTIAETGISPTNILIAFKNYATYQVSGIFTPSGLPSITKVQTDMGCSAGRSIQFLPRYGLMRLTHKGFALYDGLSDTLVSEPIRPYLFGQDELTGIDWSTAALSTAAQLQNPPIYVCACPCAMQPPQSSTRVFVYDFIRQTWMILTFPFPFATINLLLFPTPPPQLQAGEAGGNRVVRLFAGDEDDDGVPIPWSVRLPPFAGLLTRAYIRRCLLTLYHIRPLQAISATFVIGPAALPQTVTATEAVSQGALALPNGSVQQVVEDVVLFDIGRTGIGCTVEFSGSGFLGIRNLAFHVQPKPLTRPMRV